MIEISVVVPVYNESANLPANLERMVRALTLTDREFEIIPVDDGSTDNSADKIRQYSSEDPRVRYAGYVINGGRGKAIRTGFKAARGKYILTIDCDLSYSEEYLTVMYRLLADNPEIDMVIGSPYMTAGRTENVPFKRLAVSKFGNVILSAAMHGKIKTLTGVLRGYKAEVVKHLDLESDGKEIHLEILSKALAMGYRPLEFPAVLQSRKKGKSKFRFKATAFSHLLFSFFERPSLLFGLIGLLLIAAGAGIGIYIIYLWQAGTLNPNRPLMTLMILLMVSGLQVILFGFLGTQMVALRKEIYKIQRRQYSLEDTLRSNDSRNLTESEIRRHIPLNRNASHVPEKITHNYE
ncbi:Family 2 glycosyl transferase [Candidatus Zixiibacteriota bacterium]|nr:Family 2 glycosyl transferase [candidate division Zixibacteria bacterium]